VKDLCRQSPERRSWLDRGPAMRRAGLCMAAKREVTVIGVDLVPWLIEELKDFDDDHPIFDVLIIDETSRLKDPSGKRSRALLKIASRFRPRWRPTGSPRRQPGRSRRRSARHVRGMGSRRGHAEHVPRFPAAVARSHGTVSELYANGCPSRNRNAFFVVGRSLTHDRTSERCDCI
jgi:hypothetical protein